MRVDLMISLGSGPLRNAYKTIELDFAPIPGMLYHDGTWKGNGQTIQTVTIEQEPDQAPYLIASLAPDKRNADEIAETYRAWDWQVD